MNSETDFEAPATMRDTSPLYWSIRRELWEHRAVILAPLIVAGIVMFATLISTIGLPRKIRNLPTLDPARQHRVVVKPFTMAPAPIMLTAIFVGVFVSLDAMYGDRRDRSILFWKSLPVSDVTTVAAKASIPLVVLPAIAFVLSVLALTILLFVSTLWLIANGVSPARLWGELHFVQEPVIMAYGLIVHTLWFAPIYCWLLLISAWARRAPLLWAVLPLLAISAFERAAFNSWSFMRMLEYRVGGAMKEAFAIRLTGGSHQILDQVSQLDPVRFLSAPGLWTGLLFAALCLAATVRLRRNREPI